LAAVREEEFSSVQFICYEHARFKFSAAGRTLPGPAFSALATHYFEVQLPPDSIQPVSVSASALISRVVAE